MMALVAIADAQSFSRASQDLGLTASAVSKLVSRMEERLSCQPGVPCSEGGSAVAVTSVVVDGRLHLSDSTSIREAAIAGMGIADLPRYLVEPDLAAGRLVRVLDTVPRVVRGIYVLYAGG